MLQQFEIWRVTGQMPFETYKTLQAAYIRCRELNRKNRVKKFPVQYEVRKVTLHDDGREIYMGAKA